MINCLIQYFTGLNADLTANNNKFIFVYDSTSQSYGYKAGGADTFHPFKSGAQLLGTYNGHTIDISSDYGNYKNITVDNILIVPASMQARVYTYANGSRPWSYNTQDISYTYNSSTGVITITNDILSANDGCSLCYAEIMSYKVYII